ncbi:MAG TPA: hypothetical protein EYQ21_06095 [Flavobacteriales bacterium]|nr:hypothetical protein [Flavobacteriales bacterium]
MASLRWTVKGPVSQIDHFMIFIYMRGGRRLITSVHADPSSATFGYLHKFAEAPTESFYYMVVPVDLNFSKLSSKLSNKMKAISVDRVQSKTQMDKAVVRK